MTAETPLEPSFETLFAAALRDHAAGDLAAAAAGYQRALAQNEADPRAWCNLGAVVQAQGDLSGAERCFRRAIELDGASAPAWANLGNVLFLLGRPVEAAAAYEAALTRSPADAEVWTRLGMVRQAQGREDEAVTAFAAALAGRPDRLDARVSLGKALQAIGRHNDAEAAFRQAAEAHPDHPAPWANLGRLAQVRRQYDEALRHYRHSLDLAPGSLYVLEGLSRSYQSLGMPQEAEACLKKLAASWPQPGLAVQRALLLSAIPDSRSTVQAERTRLLARLRELREKGLRLAHPEQQAVLPYFAAFHGQDNRALLSEVAALYRQICPELIWTSPHGMIGRRRPDRRLRIGFLTRALGRESAARLSSGFYTQLDQRRFETTLFHFGLNHAEAIEDARQVEKAVRLQGSLADMRLAIAAEDLDVLVYPEIGVDPTIYCLALARLAPVQAALSGFPQTSGVPGMDYFISSRDWEPADGQDHYSERLVFLDPSPHYAIRPAVPAIEGRARFGFADDVTLYVCVQRPCKFTPDFDAVLAAILRQDPKGRLLVVDTEPLQMALLKRRWQAAMPDVAARIVVLPRLDRQGYFSLLAAADALLDTPLFSGGITSYEAFALGVPIVAWHGTSFRARQTLGLYAQMELDGLVAESADEYVAMAVTLANDRALQAEWRDLIGERQGRLFENRAVIAQWETFLDTVCRGG